MSRGYLAVGVTLVIALVAVSTLAGTAAADPLETNTTENCHEDDNEVCVGDIVHTMDPTGIYDDPMDRYDDEGDPNFESEFGANHPAEVLEGPVTPEDTEGVWWRVRVATEYGGSIENGTEAWVRDSRLEEGRCDRFCPGDRVEIGWVNVWDEPEAGPSEGREWVAPGSEGTVVGGPELGSSRPPLDFGSWTFYEVEFDDGTTGWVHVDILDDAEE